MVRPEANSRTRVRLANGPHDFELATLLAAGETHVVFLAATPNPDFQVLRQRVYNGNTDAVQAAGKLVILIGKFRARVEASEN